MRILRGQEQDNELARLVMGTIFLVVVSMKKKSMWIL